MAYIKLTWDDSTWAKGLKNFQNQLNYMEEGIKEASEGGSSSYTAGEGIEIADKVISVKAEVREGAAKGNTAVQPEAINDMATKTWVGGNYYNKTVVDQKIAAIETTSFKKVEVLPETGESNVIYLVPNTVTNAGTQNIYNEYIWMETVYELIGTTQIELDSKVDKPNEPVAGQGVNVPYFFNITYNPNGAAVTDYTVDLLNKNKSFGAFTLNVDAAVADSDVPGKAGLMTSLDAKTLREAIPASIASLQDSKLNNPKVPTEAGGELNIPYFFELKYNADNVEVKDHTIDLLDNTKDERIFGLTINAASSDSAGLMKASDAKAVREDLPNKLNVLPNVDDPSDPGYNWPYHIPYKFEFTPTATDMNVAIRTLTLDNKLTKMTFNATVPSASSDSAGLMKASDAKAVREDLPAAISGKQDVLDAGANITISGNTISAVDTKYTAGTNISISGDNVISATGIGAAGYIELDGWIDDNEYHDGGTITDAQAQVLLASELSYIWMNGMHRLDFRYKQDANNLATYSANDGEKTHVIKITLSTKKWVYCHKLLLEALIVGDGIQLSGRTISATSTGIDVIANPSVSITDSTLSSILIGSNKYYLPVDGAAVDEFNNLTLYDGLGRNIVSCTVNTIINSTIIHTAVGPDETEAMKSGVTGTGWINVSSAAARVPEAPDANGKYHLVCSVLDGNKLYSWELV